MMKRMIYGLAALLLCAGCSVYKEYQRPTLPELDGLYGAAGGDLASAAGSGAENDSVSVAALGWREFFTDPLLQELIARGLENNPQVRIASQRVVEAEASLRAARLALLPTLGLSPSVSSPFVIFRSTPRSGRSTTVRAAPPGSPARPTRSMVSGKVRVWLRLRRFRSVSLSPSGARTPR